MAWAAVRSLRNGVLVLALAGSAVLTGSAALAGPATVALATAPNTLLTSVSATHQRGYDQLVFQFTGPLPAQRSARYVSRLANGSGAPVSVAGSAYLLVSFSRASGSLAFSGPSQSSYALPGVIQVVTVADQ